MSKIKKTETDIILENLKGFIRLGAAATSPGNVPTGHFDLDFAIHYGELPADMDLDTLKDYDPSKTLGLPRGKVIELFGPEGGGKSSLAYRVVGYGQKIGLKAAWIDTEHSFADNLAELNGVDRDSLFYSNMTNHLNPEQLFYAEDVFDGIIAMIKSGIKVIVLDSVANLVSKERMEKDAESFVVARVARLMSDNLGKIVAYADKEGAYLLSLYFYIDI
jgi:RecA/RadA recombinase